MPRANEQWLAYWKERRCKKRCQWQPHTANHKCHKCGMPYYRMLELLLQKMERRHK